MPNSSKNIRLLTPHDLAFGIGRIATAEEWELYFSTIDKNAKGINAVDFLKKAKEHLNTKKKNIKISV